MNRAVMIDADKGRNLRYGVNAFADIRQMLGSPMTQLSTENMDFAEIRTLFYCGLKWEDPNLTVEQTGDIIDILIEKHGMSYVTEKMVKAITLATGQAGQTGQGTASEASDSKKKNQK